MIILILFGFIVMAAQLIWVALVLAVLFIALSLIGNT